MRSTIDTTDPTCPFQRPSAPGTEYGIPLLPPQLLDPSRPPLTSHRMFGASSLNQVTEIAQWRANLFLSRSIRWGTVVTESFYQSLLKPRNFLVMLHKARMYAWKSGSIGNGSSDFSSFGQMKRNSVNFLLMLQQGLFIRTDRTRRSSTDRFFFSLLFGFCCFCCLLPHSTISRPLFLQTSTASTALSQWSPPKASSSPCSALLLSSPRPVLFPLSATAPI